MLISSQYCCQPGTLFKTNWPKIQALHTGQGFKTRLTAWVCHMQLFNAWTSLYRGQYWWVHQALKGLAENCGLIWSCSGTFCQKIGGCDKIWAGIMASTGKDDWFSFDLIPSITCEMVIGEISVVFCGDRDSCKWRDSNDHHRCHCFPSATHHTGQLGVEISHYLPIHTNFGVRFYIMAQFFPQLHTPVRWSKPGEDGEAATPPTLGSPNHKYIPGLHFNISCFSSVLSN